MQPVSLTGNLVADPEQFTLPSGKQKVRFRVATNETTTREGQTYEETSFFDVEVWNGQGDNLKQSLNKGDRVVVIGKLKFNEWRDESGAKHTRTYIHASEVGASLLFAPIVVVPRGLGDGEYNDIDMPGMPVGAERPF